MYIVDIIILICLYCFIGVESIVLIVEAILLLKQRKNKNQNIDYFSKVIHDLKTPIYAIDGYTLLAGQNLEQPQKVKEYLDKISSVSTHMSALVKDVNEISKLKDNKLTLNYQIKNLSDVLACCLENVEPQILKRSIHFVKSIQLVHSCVLVDDLHLIQILTNILSNAIKYTEANGSISFSVTEEEITQESATYIFKIQDTGYGMSEEFQKHIFEPFAQERSAAHTDVEGSGLGLFIVKKLVDMMKGNISVESKQNEGSCFTIRLHLDYIDKE